MTMIKGRLVRTGEEEGAVVEEPVVPAPTPSEVEAKKGRFSGVFESSRLALEQWQQSVDEKFRAMMPRFLQLKELEDEVSRLSKRVEELEAKLADSPKQEGGE